MVDVPNAAVVADRSKPRDNPTYPFPPKPFLEMTAERKSFFDYEMQKSRYQTILRVTLTQQDKAAAAFNPRKPLSDVMKNLAKADNSIKFFYKESIEVVDPDNLPADDEFFNKLVVVDETGPQANRAKVSISFAALMSYPLHVLKQKDPELLPYLGKNKISIRVDNYVGDRVCTIGLIANIHPRQFNRDHIKQEIIKMLKKSKLTADRIQSLPDDLLSRWLTLRSIEEEAHALSEAEGSDDEEDKDTTMEDDNPNGFETVKKSKKISRKKAAHTIYDNGDKEVDFTAGIKIPKFDIIVGTRYAGTKNKKVSAEFLEIQCAVKDAKFLNLILSMISDPTKPTLPFNGQYFPTGFSSSDDDKNNFWKMVVQQGNYLRQTMAIHVENLNDQILREPIEDANGKYRPFHDVLEDQPSVEFIINTNIEGTYAFITTSNRIGELRKMLDGPFLEQFTTGKIPQSMWYNEEAPCRKDIKKVDPTVHSYSQAVLNNFANTPMQTTNLPRHSRRTLRSKPKLVFKRDDDTNFPALPEKEKASYKNPKKRAKTTPATSPPVNDETPATTPTTPSSILGANFTKLCEQVAKSIAPEIRAEMQEAMAKPNFADNLTQHTNDYLALKKEISDLKISLKESQEQSEKKHEQRMEEMRADNQQRMEEMRADNQRQMDEIKRLMGDMLTKNGLHPSEGWNPQEITKNNPLSTATTESLSGASSL